MGFLPSAAQPGTQGMAREPVPSGCLCGASEVPVGPWCGKVQGDAGFGMALHTLLLQ